MSDIARRAHDEVLANAERTADQAEAAVRAAWDRLLAAIEHRHPWHWQAVYHAALAALEPLAGELRRSIAGSLHDAARRAHASARRLATPRSVLEGGGLPPAAPVPTLSVGDVFAAPPIFDLTRVIFAGDWASRLAAQTRLADPAVLAAIVANGLQQGRTPAQIARDVRPALQGVQSSARRVARTETMRVAHETQLQAWEGMADAVGILGYQIHSAHRGNSRPWHVARDGTVYYRSPGPGQKGFDKMPRPPLEAPDPSERPAGTPHVASNCLCWLTPVMA